MIEDIYNNFGEVKTCIDNHRYIEIINKLKMEELELINIEKMKIITN